MDTETLLETIRNRSSEIEFSDVMSTIDTDYDYRPALFVNGGQVNEAGTNEGSCKIFAFARLHNLDEEHTLACFGRYYRDDVLQNPDGDDHANIRNFMVHGWQGLEINSNEVLSRKT